MFVKDYMTKHPVMVEPTMTIVDVQGVMSEAKIRHLPVIKEGKRLVGLVTRERLRIPTTELGSLNVWEITRYLSNLRVRDLMVKRKDVLTTVPDETLERVAQIMVGNKVGCLPVLEDGIVIGILTDLDLLNLLSDLLGGNIHGTRATIRVPNVIGEYAKITSAMASKGWGIYASGGLPTPKNPDLWDLVIKLRNVPPDQLVKVLEQIEGHEIIDVRES